MAQYVTVRHATDNEKVIVTMLKDDESPQEAVRRVYHRLSKHKYKYSIETWELFDGGNTTWAQLGYKGKHGLILCPRVIIHLFS